MGHSPGRRHRDRLRADPRTARELAETELTAGSDARESSLGDSRIRLWLGQIGASSHSQPKDNPDDLTVETFQKPSWRPHNFPPFDTGTNNRKDARIETDRAVRDDFLLLSSSSEMDGQDSTTAFSSSENDHQSPVKQKRRRAASQTGSNPHTEDFVFEKRPRRKTKCDKYDVTKRRQKPTATGKWQASRSNKRRNVAKSKLRSGREVMHNFSSAAIADLRVTTKPNLTTGLFLNGRGSKSNPLSDLDFNDVKILDYNDSDEANRQSSRTRTRSRDGRRKERELQAESDFFADSSAPKLLASGLNQPSITPGMANRAAAKRRTTTHRTQTSTLVGERNEKSLIQADSALFSKDHESYVTVDSSAGELETPASPSSSLRTSSTARTPGLANQYAIGGESPNVINTEFSTRALLETGVLDFPGLSGKINSSQSRDSQKALVDQSPGTGKVESLTCVEPKTTIHTDKDVMANPIRSTTQEPRSPHLPSILGAGKAEFVECPDSDLDKDNTYRRRIDNRNEAGRQPRMPSSYQPAQCVDLEDNAMLEPKPEPRETLANGSRYRNQTHAASHGTKTWACNKQNSMSVSENVDETAQDTTVNPRKDNIVHRLTDEDKDDGNPYFTFPRNRPSVQPLRYGVLGPQFPRSSRTPSNATQYQKPTSHELRGPTNDLWRSSECLPPQLIRSQPAEPSNQISYETMPEFIKRMEDEVFGRSELYPPAETENYSMVDNGANTGLGYTVPRRHDSAHRTDPKPPYSDGGVVSGYLMLPGDSHLQASCVDFTDHRFGLTLPGETTQNSCDLEMAAFWRPNRFL